MLPASTGDRKQRDVTRGRPDGRTVEIQRLIGRSLRGVVDFSALGENTIYLDCDVLTADGGTRCASITGAYVALALACDALRERGRARALAAHRLGGRGVGGDRRRRGAARPRLLRGLERRGRRQRRHDRRRRPDRGPGHRRAHAAVAGEPRRAARARRARASSELQAAQERAVGATRAREARPRHPQPAQGARAGGAARRPRGRAAAGRCGAARPRRARPSPPTRCPRRARPPRRPASRPSATTRASSRPRSAARPACTRRASPARTRPTPTTWPC